MSGQMSAEEAVQYIRSQGPSIVFEADGQCVRLMREPYVQGEHYATWGKFPEQRASAADLAAALLQDKELCAEVLTRVLPDALEIEKRLQGIPFITPRGYIREVLRALGTKTWFTAGLPDEVLRWAGIARWRPEPPASGEDGPKE